MATNQSFKRKGSLQSAKVKDYIYYAGDPFCQCSSRVFRDGILLVNALALKAEKGPLSTAVTRSQGYDS